jgi:hypothetical protein
LFGQSYVVFFVVTLVFLEIWGFAHPTSGNILNGPAAPGVFICFWRSAVLGVLGRNLCMGLSLFFLFFRIGQFVWSVNFGCRQFGNFGDLEIFPSYWGKLNNGPVALFISFWRSAMLDFPALLFWGNAPTSVVKIVFQIYV